MEDAAGQLQRTPLFERHRALGARIVPFAGWEMPVQYTGAIDEVRAVRRGAGLFDVSHMGELHVSGAGALAWLNSMTTNDVSRLAVGRAQYSLVLREDAGILDDILVYRLDDEDYMVVVNASNTEKIVSWFLQYQLPGVTIEDSSPETALLALQGPRALDVLQPMTPIPLSEVRRWGVVSTKVAGIDCLLARTGYTGEDGFEMFTQGDVVALWDAILDEPEGSVKPCGLAARDVCRIEAGNVLYGHEIGEGMNPISAGLKWVVRMEKGAFMGSDALAGFVEKDVEITLIGLEMRTRAIARQDYPIHADDESVGFVTSGTYSPTLEKPIGMGYVPPDMSEAGTELQVIVRGRPEPAVVAPLPFYRGPGR